MLKKNKVQAEGAEVLEATESKALKKRTKKSTASVGLILFLLDKLTDSIYSAFCNGFFGKIFTSYSKEQAAFENGFLRNHFISAKFKAVFWKIRLRISKMFETSWFLCKTKNTARSWLGVPLKSYGKATFFFGVYTVLVYLIRLILPNLTEADLSSLITGVVLCVISLPMFLSKESLARALDSGVITNMLCSEFLGYRKESFEITLKASRTKSNILIFLGMLLGMLTLFVHPLLLVLAILLLMALLIVLNTPEIGVLLAIFFLPFLSFFAVPSTILGMIVLITAISYFVKLIRGKRLLRMELLDLAVLLFFALIFFSGAITVSEQKGWEEVLLSCCLMFGYFLTVNLIRTSQWLKRCTLALISSGTIVAMLGILQYFFAAVSVDAWVDRQYFSEISNRAVSLFENPNVLASYLVLVLPFVLLAFLRSPRGKGKTLYLISLLSVLSCIVLTWSRGAWLAVIASVLVFGFIYSKKTLRTIFFFILSLPMLSVILPSSFKHRFMSIGNLADSSTAYRYYTWKGSWNIVEEYFWSGIGYGPTAYQTIYPQYAYAGIEAAEHSHSLFLQILIGLGIGGLLVFFCILFLASQMNFEYLKNGKNQASRFFIIATMCSVLGALVMGCFDYIWYNYRIFFLFWVVLGLACACIRISRAEEQRHAFVETNETNYATKDLGF
ncbi:MAG: O-antigen ligase family protein [Clostridia bacterium]|nr:O-antigen ligase family protein [Clostridia bacterium]